MSQREVFAWPWTLPASPRQERPEHWLLWREKTRSDCCIGQSLGQEPSCTEIHNNNNRSWRRRATEGPPQPFCYSCEAGAANNCAVVGHEAKSVTASNGHRLNKTTDRKKKGLSVFLKTFLILRLNFKAICWITSQRLNLIQKTVITVWVIYHRIKAELDWDLELIPYEITFDWRLKYQVDVRMDNKLGRFIEINIIQQEDCLKETTENEGKLEKLKFK